VEGAILARGGAAVEFWVNAAGEVVLHPPKPAKGARERALSFSTLEALDDVVRTLALELREIPRPALFLAAKAFAQYRRRGGSKAQVLPDFFIGAHAAVEGWPLLTRDAARFRTCFPTLDVIAP
jgi:predicted nucleic acid-binding protein